MFENLLIGIGITFAIFGGFFLVFYIYGKLQGWEVVFDT